MKTYKINNSEIQVKDFDDWKTTIEKDFKPGDYVADELVWELINRLPPRSLEPGYFQVGEPHSHRADSSGRFRPTFATFEKVHNTPSIWKYCGNCFGGESENIK